MGDQRALEAREAMILFTHAHSVRMLTACWVNLPPDVGYLFVLRTASISVLGFEHGGRVMARWNLLPEAWA